MSSLANRASSRRRWRARRSWSATGVDHKERRNLEVRSNSFGCQGCHPIATENSRSVNYSDECGKPVESVVRDDAAGAERLDKSKRRKGEGAPEPDAVVGQSSSSSRGAAAGSGEGHASRGTRRTAEDAGLPNVHDLAENRAVQTAHGDRMRYGELHCEMSEVAEVFHPGRLAASRRSPMLGDIGRTKSNGCDRQLTTVVEVSCEAFGAWRHAAVLRQKDSRI